MRFSVFTYFFMRGTTDWTDVAAPTMHQQRRYYGVLCLYFFLMSFLRDTHSAFSILSDSPPEVQRRALRLWMRRAVGAENIIPAATRVSTQPLSRAWSYKHHMGVCERVHEQIRSNEKHKYINKYKYKSSADLEKGRLFQHVEEFWEIISDFLVHGSHQADLPHGSGPVRSWTVSPTHLGQGKKKIVRLSWYIFWIFHISLNM